MKLSDNLTGAVFMMVAMAAFTVNDMFMKLMSGSVPLIQLIFLRGILTTIAVSVLAWRLGAFRGRIAGRDRLIVAIRTGSEICATYFFLTALTHMPLANVTAILQALPLAIAVAAALFLGEGFGWKRLVAIVVGFVGVLLIVRPGAEGFNVYSLYGLVAVGFVTVRDLSTRRLSRETSSMLVTWVTALSITVVYGLASITIDWGPMDGGELVLLVLASSSIIAGYLFSIMVMRVGEISFVAPFRYTGLVWALVLGWFAFGDWPSNITLLGAAIVAGSGIFTIIREAREGRRTPMQYGPRIR
ncbi:DMT family transporter [Roseovarius sp. SCSIO 43702]|uniref:DMT family transporter n=1 Tax=Roseovarius sp. SCSIO 43702 TaxID=2823043 RepID=UPI001C73DD17|nr:DMT family transporter [Roseovarius sp. SCSIO 43702]QYX57739.1 DMT family transporter [Roseovarius sp. SCSIO 43702]